VFAASKPKEGSQEEEGTDLKRRPLAVAGMKKKGRMPVVGHPTYYFTPWPNKTKGMAPDICGEERKSFSLLGSTKQKGKKNIIFRFP